MRLSERIGILLFLDTRNELSEDEQKELSAWRLESSENEQLYGELADPDFMRRTLKEYYQQRDEVFQMLKRRFPHLADAKLSNEPGFEDDDPEDQLYRESFPEKQLSESGLSKPEFWHSMIPEYMLSGDAQAKEKDGLVQSLPEMGKSRSNRNKRNLFISMLAAASLILGIIHFAGFDSGGDFYQAGIVFPDGSRTMLTDFARGALDGWADISFEHTEKGERVCVFGNKPGKGKTDHYTLFTSAGKEYILKLPDGSRIWMNAQSTIDFPANFLQDTIVLKLEGEAFFELAAHSPHHYMIKSELKAQGIMIQEMGLKRGSVEFERRGTQLNISAYASDSGMKATFVGGTAKIENISSLQEILLQTGQQVILNRGIAELNPAADPAQVTAWKNGDFNFKDVPIQNIMPELERWYDVSVNYQGRISDKRFRIQVSRTARLSKVLGILEKQGLRVNKKGTKLTITF